MSSQVIPVAQPSLWGNEKSYVMDCLDSNWISSNGSYIERFETCFAERLGVSHALTCCNGTVALHLALMALGIGPGDEVVVPTLTYVASANAVVYCGATPVFVDSDPESWNLDPQCVERAITTRTRAIVAVHLYGVPADLAALRALADRHRIFLVEDAAQAPGAHFAERAIGAWGDIASFSFYGNKILTTGEGGMVTTNNSDLAQRVLHLKSQGMDPQRRYWFTEIGYNYRMTNLAAALGLAQLERLDDYLAQRETLWRQYQDRLSDLEGMTLQTTPEHARPVRWMVNVLLPEDCSEQRDRVMEAMLEQGVETRPAFAPLHLLPPYLSTPPQSLPLAEGISARGITLPTWVGLDAQGVVRVCASLQASLATCSRR
jgi:perosamine synthetase